MNQPRFFNTCWRMSWLTASCWQWNQSTCRHYMSRPSTQFASVIDREIAEDTIFDSFTPTVKKGRLVLQSIWRRLRILLVWRKLFWSSRTCDWKRSWPKRNSKPVRLRAVVKQPHDILAWGFACARLSWASWKRSKIWSQHLYGWLAWPPYTLIY